MSWTLEKQLFEPNLLIPGRKPRGSVKATVQGGRDYWPLLNVSPTPRNYCGTASLSVVGTAGVWSHKGGNLAYQVAGSTGYLNAQSHEVASGWTRLIGFQVTAVGSEQALITTAESPGHGTFDRTICILGSNQIVGYIYSGGAKTVTDPAMVSAGDTVHAAITVDGSTLRLYKNGAEVANVAAGGAYTGYTTPEVVIGYGSRNSATGAGTANIFYAADIMRVLSAGELALLAADPYKYLSPNVAPLAFKVPGAAPAGAYMPQIQGANLGSDLYNGTIQ